MIKGHNCILICKIRKKENNYEPRPINKIDDVLEYFNKGYFNEINFYLINQNQINQKYQLTSKYYEKNNNIIIDFEKNDGKALLLMNTTITSQELDRNNFYLIEYKEPKVNNAQNKMNIFNQILNYKTIEECQNNLDNFSVKIIPMKNLLQSNAKKPKSKSQHISNKSSEKSNNRNHNTKKDIFVEIEKLQINPCYNINQLRKNSRQKSAQNKVIVQKKTEDIHGSYNNNVTNTNQNNKNKNFNLRVFNILKKEFNNNLKLKENLEKKEQNKINTNENINKNKIMPANIIKKAIIKINPKKEKEKEKTKFDDLEKIKMLNKLYNAENIKLKNENSKLNEFIKELNQRTEKMEYLNNEYEKKKKELDKMNKLYENQQDIQNKLKNSNENYRIENNNLKEEIKKKNKEIEDLKNKIKEINKQNEILIEKFKQNQNDELKNLRIKIEELERQLKISEEKNIRNENELKENKKVIKELKDEINKLKEQIKIKDQEIKNLHEKIKTLEELINKNSLNTTESILKSNHDYIDDKNNNKNKRIEIYAKDTNEINKEIVEKNNLKEKEIESLKIEINNIKETMKSLNEENNDLKKKKKELDDLLNQKEKEISNLKIKNKELQNKSENDTKLMTQLKTQLNNCINDIKNSNQNIDSLKKQILEYQKKEKKYQNLDKKEKELNIRANNIYNKEKELNEKSQFLNNETNLLESEHQQLKLQIQNYLKINNQLKYENDNLSRINQNLQNQILNYKQMFSNIQPNLPQNNIVQIIQNNIMPQNNQSNKISNENNNNNNINREGNKKEIEPIKKYAKPTLIGLNNIGATCFMNSTLQCLSQTESLTNYFLKEKNRDKIINNNVAKNNKNDNQLSPEYLELIQKLWDANSKKSFSPYNFMQKINDMNPLFKKGEAGDAKDFIIFILEQMHRELKMPLNDNNLNKNIDDIPLNQYDKMNAFNHFFEEFKKETSILTDTFFGFNETTNVCLYCKNTYNSKGLANPICYNYGIFNVLIFPLEEVKNMKINMGQNNIINQGIPMVTIYDCFLYNQKTDYFTGENKNYCNICRQLYESQYTSRIFVSPNVLIIILNRGKGNIYKIKLDFQQDLDITDFVIQKEKDRIKYKLYGVITHLGESGPNAHFVASCKSPVDNNWYRYNDAFVDPIPNFQKDIYDFGNPYILFYEKEK